jgi:hypothetical protein
MRVKKLSTAFRAVLVTVPILLLCGGTFALDPRPVEILIPCGAIDYYLTVGSTDFVLLDDKETPDGSWILYNPGANDEARVMCGAGCLGIVGLGGCDTEPSQTYSETDVQCPNGDNFEISTGTEAGTCEVSQDANGNVTGGTCSDGNNSASVSCSANAGQGACSGTQGSGDCDCETCEE